MALVKKLIPQLHHAIAEYHSHSQPLGDHLSGGFERSLAVLERMASSLEAYLATHGPDGAPDWTPAGRRASAAADHDRIGRRPLPPESAAAQAATGDAEDPTQTAPTAPGSAGGPAGEASCSGRN